MTLHAYRNKENRTNRVVFLILARNSSDPFQTSHGKSINDKLERPLTWLWLTKNLTRFVEILCTCYTQFTKQKSKKKLIQNYLPHWQCLVYITRNCTYINVSVHLKCRTMFKGTMVFNAKNQPYSKQKSHKVSRKTISYYFCVGRRKRETFLK